MSKRNRKGLKRHLLRRRTPPGSMPGTLTADPKALPPVISIMGFGPNEMVEKRLDSPREIEPLLGRWPVLWVNVDGLGNADVIAEIGKIFNLHHLALEDVLNVHQRSKVEEYGDLLFIVVRMVSFDRRLETEQVSIFLGKDFVLTFQERPGVDSIEPVRHRIRAGRGKIRTADSGYLAYSLIDATIDGYFPVLEKYGDRLEELDAELIERCNPAVNARIHEVKGDLLVIRRAIWPHREAISGLMRDPNHLISDETRIYLRDCYDHVVQLIDMVETYRELGADLRDLYLSTVSNRMNEVVKVLTVISTIFIPLTFIAGVYGMNFNTQRSPLNMPELNWYYGYPFSLVVMGLVTLAMIAFFYRRGWVGPRARELSCEVDTNNHNEVEDSRGG